MTGTEGRVSMAEMLRAAVRGDYTDINNVEIAECRMMAACTALAPDKNIFGVGWKISGFLPSNSMSFLTKFIEWERGKECRACCGSGDCDCDCPKCAGECNECDGSGFSGKSGERCITTLFGEPVQMDKAA